MDRIRNVQKLQLRPNRADSGEDLTFEPWGPALGAAVVSDFRAPAEPVIRRGPLRVVKAIVSTIAGVALAVVALLAVGLAVGTHLSGGQLGLLGHPVMSVLSGSMAPAINTGDLVVDDKLSPAQAANLHVGQIISFRAGAGSSQIFTHRIVAVQPLPGGGVGYSTKGDANDSRDGPITPSTNVVGLYQSKIADGGYVLNALHRPLVIGLLLASPILWLLAEPLWNWARQEEEREIDPSQFTTINQKGHAK
jgi:signal peptidase